MSDEPKHGRGSHKPVKLGRKRSQGQDKLKSVASSANGSDHQSDASSNNNSLSKSQRASLPTGLQKGNKEAIASGETLSLKWMSPPTDSASTEIRAYLERTDLDSNNALIHQVVGVVTNGGTHDLQNLKWALATVLGIGPKMNWKDCSQPK